MNNSRFKFRAWHKESKEMILFKYDGVCDEYSHLAFSAVEKKYRGICALPIHFNDYKSEKKIILMQYTGLTDKNGKEIYEGDILDYRGSGTTPYKLEVVYSGATFNIAGLIIDDYVVIGNIYENPNLSE